MQYVSPNPDVKSYLTQYNIAELEYVYRSIDNSFSSIKVGKNSYYIPSYDHPSKMNHVLALGEDIVRNFRYCIIMNMDKKLFILFNFDNEGDSISLSELCEALEVNVSVCSYMSINTKLNELFELDDDCTWYSLETAYSVYQGSSYNSTKTDIIMGMADCIYDRLVINKII